MENTRPLVVVANGQRHHVGEATVIGGKIICLIDDDVTDDVRRLFELEGEFTFTPNPEATVAKRYWSEIAGKEAWAAEFTMENRDEVRDWCDGAMMARSPMVPDWAIMKLNTIGGWKYVRYGDVVVRGESGWFFPYSREAFDKEFVKPW